jgi:methionyl-tRNA formyltransferase
MGTPEFAARSLEGCLEVGEVLAVVTQPDKPKGRGQELAAPPVKVIAETRGIAVLQPPKIRGTGFAEELKRFSPDVCVVTAYGKILPKDVLAVPRLGCLNVHASLLPRFRGAAPIQWAIAEGDAVTGVCLMQMDEGMDTGPVLARRELPIRDDDTFATLHDRLALLGRELLVAELPRFLEGKLTAVPQPQTGVTLAPIIRKEQGRLDFARPATVLERRIRAFTPWPGAYTTLHGGLLKVHRAKVRGGSGAPGQLLSASADGLEVACGEGSLLLVEVQPEGKRRMTAAELQAGRKLLIGDHPFS